MITVLTNISIFLGSFLLFLLQPMLGNVMLPSFGGTASTWVVCLCTFQVLLVVGYAYAHFISRFQFARVHALCIIFAALAFPSLVHLAKSVSDKISEQLPFCSIMLFVAVAAGTVYVLLSANASLVQSIAATNKNCYGLYAVSNTGSFCGLLAYPFVLERCLTVKHQLGAFSVVMCIYGIILLCLTSASVKDRLEHARLFMKWGGAQFQWFALAFVSCFLLNSISSHLCMDVSPLPLLWSITLAVYLLTWIAGYSSKLSRAGILMLPVVIVLVCYAIFHQGGTGEEYYIGELSIGILTLFFGCWFVHSLLYRLRPDVQYLTQYYFILSLGGAVGGIAASVLAPLMFSSVFEYPIALSLLMGVSFFCVCSLLKCKLPLAVVQKIRYVIWIVVAGFSLASIAKSRSQTGVRLLSDRNFYGTVDVSLHGWDYHHIAGVNECIELTDNGTVHGMQIADQGGQWKGLMPTTYYTEIGGGQAIKGHPNRMSHKPIHGAFLGMGVGTLATYGNRGDRFHFVEINPLVSRIAQDNRYFTFVKESLAEIKITVNDARKQLEREQSLDAEKYDLIVIDVFSGDAIPAHMATKEAMQLYLDRLMPDGIIAFHLSNWHLNLSPIIKALAIDANLHLVGVLNQATETGLASYWAYMSRDPIPYSFDPKTQHRVDYGCVDTVPVPTDEFHPMTRFLKVDPLCSLKFIKD